MLRSGLATDQATEVPFPGGLFGQGIPEEWVCASHQGPRLLAVNPPDHDVCPPLDGARWERFLESDEEALSRTAFDEALERQLLRRLAQAWRDLNYCHLRDRLKAPSIQLHAGEARWGAWHPSKRLITIARRQVLLYTWDSVLETLKHEIAHQVVSETMGDPPESAHGPAFRDACRLLAADPAARGDGGISLFRPAESKDLSADDARLRKVHKLLALADNNPDEHEARAAFARASELMLAYNLDGLEAEGARQRTRDREHLDYAYRQLGRASARVAHHHYVIAGILQKFFFVQCLWVEHYDVQTGKKGHLLEVMGTHANVSMADYVHACLLRQSEALWLAYKKEHQIKDRSAKRQYLDGLLEGFRRQLEKTTVESAERGLIWVGDAGLDRYTRRRHPKVTRSKLGGVPLSEARAAGVKAGAKLRLHKPLGARRSSGRGGHLTG